MLTWLIIAFLSLVLCMLDLLNTAPAFNLPLVPELALLSICIWANTSFKRWRPQTIPENRGLLRIALAFCLTLLTVTIFRAVAAYNSLQSLDPLCSVLGSFLPQLECLFQAGIEQNANVRQLCYMLVACAIGATSFRSAHADREPDFIPWAFVAHAAIFVSLTRLLIATHEHLPGFFISQQFAESRFAVLVENPTWIWPLLIPALVSILYLHNKSSTRVCRSFLLLLNFSVLVLFLQTQQRGALLAASWTALWMALPYFRKLPWKRRFLPLYAIAGLLFACGIIGFFFAEKDLLFRRLFIEGMHSGRTSMWTLALNLMEKNWLFGHGYGSWFRVFGEKALKSNVEAYDTAHNFFIQTLFELGLLHLLAIFATIGMIGLVLIKKLQRKNRPLLATLIHALGLWLLALTVQEVDFIRSTYYSNAACLGWLVGISLREDVPLFVSRITAARRVLAGLGFLAGTTTLVIAVFVLSKFSIGGYQFEAHYSNHFQTKVRWLRPSGTLGSYQHLNAPHELTVYSLYPIVHTATQNLDIRRYNGEWKHVPIHLKAKQESYLPVPIQKWYQPPLFYRSQDFYPYESRYLAVLLAWPPVSSSLPFVSAEGFWPWETSPIDGLNIRWCGETCTAQLLDCLKVKEKRVLTLMAARPDISTDNPLQVEIKDQTSTQILEFDNPNQSRELVLNPGETFQLTVYRTYQTPEDSRPKGVLFTKSECRIDDTLRVGKNHP